MTLFVVGVAAAGAPPAGHGGKPLTEHGARVLRTLEGEQVGDNFGGLAANIGDIDGDGVHDFVTAAPLFVGAGPAAGRVYVFSGKKSKLLQTHDGAPGDRLGFASGHAGDVDGDGVPDYVVGGPGLPPQAGGPKGRVIVYSGKTHAVLHELAVPPNEGFGSSVTGAGDLNGDGYDDLFVGAALSAAAGPFAGRVVAYSGKDGSMLWHHEGHAPGGRLGAAVGRVGDVDGDGADDLAGGAPGIAGGAGEVYLFSGADGHVIYTLAPNGEPGGGSFGSFFASAAGDVNRDRVPDIFVGDWNAVVNGVPGTGRVYLFSGADGSLLRRLEAEKPGDGFGVGRAIGDVDRDGHDDLVIAAYTSSAGAPQGGRAYVYSGRTGRALRTMTGAVANDNLGVDALSIGDVNHDGLVDFLLTATGASFQGTGVGRIHVVAGTRLDGCDERADGGLAFLSSPPASPRLAPRGRRLRVCWAAAKR